jgi:hypothetical protein
MDRRERVGFGVVLLALLIAQLSCGDSSGPGRVASSIVANSATTQTASPGTDVAERPSVVVRDQNGAALGGVSVTFAVTAGGGSVTGSTVVSSPAGVATVGSWMVGTAEGVNTVTATSGTLSLTFTANSVDPCVIGGTHPIGGTTAGELTTSDCAFSDGSFVDLYDAFVTATGTYVFDQSSSSFDTYLILFDANANPIGFNDDFGTGNDSRIKAILPPGNYVLGANSLLTATVGPYTLTSALDGTPVTNCEFVFVARGITSSQTLQASDCPRPGGYYGDQFFIYVAPGQPVTVSMSSTAVDSYIAIYDPNGSVLIVNDDKDGTTKDAQVVFTPSVEGFYGIIASSGNVGATGGYTVVVQ